jgi:2'-5' RNA ligase
MDLFPNSLSPDSLGFHGVALTMPHFFALYPDDIARTRIVERQRELCERIGLKRSAWRPRRVFHITIAEWGEGKRLREPYEIALQKSMERFSFPAFDVALIATARFNAGAGGWAFVLEGDAATARHAHGLRNALADAQQSQGLSAPRSVFRPHLTIAHGANIPEEPLPIEPIRFRARHIEMVVSNFGKSEHIHLDRWKLHAVDNP